MRFTAQICFVGFCFYSKLILIRILIVLILACSIPASLFKKLKNNLDVLFAIPFLLSAID